MSPGFANGNGKGQSGYSPDDLFWAGDISTIHKKGCNKTKKYAPLKVMIGNIEVTKYLRKEQNMLPICILSAKDEVTDRVLGLESGADDYLIKPFAFSELLARINALLRREHPTSSKIIKLNHLTIDPQSRIATYSDKPLNLTKIEFDLLTVLADHTNSVLTRNQLLELVWGYDFEAETNVVDVFIGYLRKKLEIDESPRIIYTVRGVGFVLRS